MSSASRQAGRGRQVPRLGVQYRQCGGIIEISRYRVIFIFLRSSATIRIIRAICISRNRNGYDEDGGGNSRR